MPTSPTRPTNPKNKDKFQLQTYKDFRDYLYLIGSESITEEQLNELYKENVTIEFNHHEVTIPFDAIIYNSLVSLIETQIKEF